MCLCAKVYVGVCVNLLNGGVAVGGVCHKNAHKFQLDSSTCTRVCVKVGHELKDSSLIFDIDWLKEGSGSGPGEKGATIN